MAHFTTTRDSISYDMMPDYRESYAEGHYTREQICLVPWSQKAAFLRAILPQVSVDESTTVETLTLSPFGATAGDIATVPRRRLLRKNPQVHPNDSYMFASDYEVLNGGGFPVKDTDGQYAFKTWAGTSAGGTTDGKCMIRVTWKTLPYRVDISDAAANAVGASELMRYCSLKMSYAGQNLEVQPGRSPLRLFSPVQVVQNGSVVELPAADLNQSLTVNIRKPIAETHVAVTWHYVPVIPHAAQMMQGLVNQTSLTPPSIIHRRPWRIGTLLYLSPEISPEFYTYEGTKVVNITYHLLHRDFGRGMPFGHNFLFSHTVQQFVRIARALGGEGPTGAQPWPGTRIDANFNVTGGGNAHDYAELLNLFRVDGATPTYS